MHGESGQRIAGISVNGDRVVCAAPFDVAGTVGKVTGCGRADSGTVLRRLVRRESHPSISEWTWPTQAQLQPGAVPRSAPGSFAGNVAVSKALVSALGSKPPGGQWRRGPELSCFIQSLRCV
jgi:hypothetical protein